MQQQKYDDTCLKFAQPKKNADGSYTITVKQLLSGHFNTKDVNQFCNTQKLWQKFLSKNNRSYLQVENWYGRNN